MSEVSVQQVRLALDGRLRVQPVAPSEHNFIWRDASSVRWDGVSSELYVLGNVDPNPIAQFARIVGAVRVSTGIN